MAARSAHRRTKLGALGAALAIAAIAGACSTGPTPSAAPAPAAQGCNGPGGPPDATTSAIFNATNASRGASGLGGLRWDPQLWCLASGWSRVMGDSGSMRHRDIGASLNSAEFAGYRTLGENVLNGPAGMSGDAMHAAWMNSPAHRANILSGAFSSFAVAIYNNGQVWATENFGG